ncbi:MAG TPA: hypothetical protein VOA88_04070 [Candidatus Dormibacteraeota bacterium]|nr:hypothetical protein [Candidatus Dormibacteraeota bacterium]
MSHETQSGISTFALSVLVAVGVIALLACAEYAIPRWLHSGPGDSGSFFSSNSSAPSAAASRPGPSIKPESGSGSAVVRNDARSARKHIPARKSSADRDANPPAPAPSDPQVSSESQDAAQPSRSPEEERAAEEKLRATEEATAHLVALEREERDRLLDRARAMKDRIEEAQRQQPVPREDLAFSQQRFQNDLNHADAALKTADVQKAKVYLDLAKGELEAIAKLLGR